MKDENFKDIPHGSAGRPSKKTQREITERIKKYYEKGIGAKATARETGYNYKTVNSRFKRWDKKLLEADNYDFVKRSKIAKEHALHFIDLEIIKCEKKEIEYEDIAAEYLRNGNLAGFERISKLSLKVTAHKNQLLSQKINLTNTPVVDTLVKLQEGEKDDS